jgi:hypothetical protein
VKRWIVFVATGAFMVLGAFVTLGAASAHPSKTRVVHVPTTLTHDGDVSLGDGRFLMTGQVKVPKEPDVCRLLRVVDVTAHFADGRTKPLDSGVSGLHGAWAVKANLSGVDRLKAKTRRISFDQLYVIRPHHRRHVLRRIVCKSASVAWRLA